MTKQKLIKLADKIDRVMQAELGSESIYNVTAATIFVLAYYASRGYGVTVLPETICMKGLIELEGATKECDCK